MIRHAEESDREFWLAVDRHLPEAEFDRKVQLRRAYVLIEGEKRAALLRYNLFWDSIPFCTLLYVLEDARGRGCGKALIEHWEREMKALGCDLVMTSTQADEGAQHFYRKLGYRDCGGFVLPFNGYEQPTELILAKRL